MKLNIEELARESGIKTDLWRMGSGSLVYTEGCHGVARAELETFARSIVESCAKRCEDEDVATTDDPVGVQECIAAAIRNLLED